VDRSQKEKMVTDLSQVFADSNLVVVAHQKGLTVAEITELRNKMREAGAKFKVTKNRLVRRALEGSQYQNLSDLFVGPTAIAYSEDSVAAAKVAVNFAKGNEKLEILGGNLNDKELGIDGIKALASLPSLDEVRAKIVGIISTPATRVAGVLQAPAGQLARVIGAYAAKGEAA